MIIVRGNNRCDLETDITDSLVLASEVNADFVPIRVSIAILKFLSVQSGLVNERDPFGVRGITRNCWIVAYLSMAQHHRVHILSLICNFNDHSNRRIIRRRARVCVVCLCIYDDPLADACATLSFLFCRYY